MPTITWSDLRREPFRLFFPLGIFFGLLGANHWLVYALGWSRSYSGFYHASIQVGMYMSCFVVGFLLTALPRFAATPSASSSELLGFLGLFLAQPVFLSFGCWIAAEVCFAGVLIALAVFAGRRFAIKRSEIGPPTEFIWIPMAILHGLIGTALLILSQLNILSAWVLAVGRPMVQQGFLLSIVAGVGGFMAPRLMGRTALLVTPSGVSLEQAQRVRTRRMAWHALAGLLLFMSFWLEGFRLMVAAYGLRAAVVTAELIWTSQLYRSPASRDLYVWLLWISLWMIVCGLWGAVLAIRFRVAMLHLVFLGGFSLMAFAVGTMVVLSHSGAGQRLRQPLWVLNVVAIGIAIAIVARLLAEVIPTFFFPFLAVTAVSWSIAGISWLLFTLPYLLRPAAPETFERVHEAAKRQLLNTSPASSR